MLDFDISKLLIILGFLGALILVQIVVKKTTFFQMVNMNLHAKSQVCSSKNG